jgi:hypothetical protein
MPLKNRDWRARFALAVEDALVKDQATDPAAHPLSLTRYLSGGESVGAKIRRLARYEPAEDEPGVILAAKPSPPRDRGS